VVESGRIEAGSGIRITRGSDTIWEGKILSLKRFKEDAKVVKEGNECGIGLPLDIDLQEGDRLEFTAMEAVAQKL
jgi:translation initiation factor IF-2